MAVKLYFATPRYDTETSMAIGWLSGQRTTLLSFANIEEPRNGFAFWLDVPERERVMKLYVAGNGKSPGSAQRDFETGTRSRLLSYAFLDDWAKDEFVFWVDNNPSAVSVFLDSGAFSAFTLGRQIDLGAYCDYIERHSEALDAYAVLDVIGDVDGTRQNLAAMRARGLDPVPVYHADREGLEVLDELLDASRYVALGGMVGTGMTQAQLRTQLDRCWQRIARHWPVRIHALGLMAQWALERYPFYSADSSSAILGAGMGRVSRFRTTEGFDACQLVADGWREDVRATLDGLVADGIGREAGGSRKSDSAHEGRRIRNIQAQLELERHVTDLWAVRGVQWQDAKES